MPSRSITLAPSLIALIAPDWLRRSPSLIQKTSSGRPSSTKSTPSVPGTCATPDASKVPPSKAAGRLTSHPSSLSTGKCRRPGGAPRPRRDLAPPPFPGGAPLEGRQAFCLLTLLLSQREIAAVHDAT